MLDKLGLPCLVNDGYHSRPTTITNHISPHLPCLYVYQALLAMVTRLDKLWWTLNTMIGKLLFDRLWLPYLSSYQYQNV